MFDKSSKNYSMEMMSEDESDSNSHQSEIEMEKLVNNVDEEISNSEGELNSKGDKHEDEMCKSSLNDSNKSKVNSGWADAMRKVLSNKKPKRKKSIVLSKAKKHCNNDLEEKKQSLSFEIEDTNDNFKNKTVKESVDEKVSEEKKRNKKIFKSGIRIKPSHLDRERERILQKIATKGVLQLFNAVRHQQIDIDKKLVEAGPLERKREKVLKDIDKKAFLDVLMGGTKSITVDNCANESVMQNGTPMEKKNVWKVLRDDFVMGASLKDWDKNTPVEENSDNDE
ncbi:RRP15-like protein isoform X1 [Leptopilina heterotoma]|uniref:RRP15-like protein isoform X1 n=2 Tax=Leptopilina heterotoma TaxID=63436 RepID=UPI001CA7CA58|nr:RRP15-like protein isoform X1 [Leptopilina heterotoma]